jgi:hypothetical protein
MGGRFVEGRSVEGRLVGRTFCSEGRFVEGRFVVVPIFTMSYWSSELPVCFPSQGTQVQIPGGILM